MRGWSRSALATLALIAAALGGCGSDEAPVAAAPAECLESWNAEDTPLTFGRHIYDTHESRRAQVAVLEAADPNPNIPGEGACAVIFAVPESDPEYGIAGLVETDFGWASMEELARTDRAALEDIQSAASDAANATLLPDGRLEPS